MEFPCNARTDYTDTVAASTYANQTVFFGVILPRFGRNQPEGMFRNVYPRDLYPSLSLNRGVAKSRKARNFRGNWR